MPQKAGDRHRKRILCPADTPFGVPFERPAPAKHVYRQKILKYSSYECIKSSEHLDKRIDQRFVVKDINQKRVSHTLVIFAQKFIKGVGIYFLETFQYFRDFLNRNIRLHQPPHKKEDERLLSGL